jgi:hypothetical protein
MESSADRLARSDYVVETKRWAAVQAIVNGFSAMTWPSTEYRQT